MTDRRLMRFADGKLSVEAELSSLAPAPCNDMVVDGKAAPMSAISATTAMPAQAPRTTCLVRVDPDRLGASSRRRADVSQRHGDHADGKTMIVGETFAHRLTGVRRRGRRHVVETRLWARSTAAILTVILPRRRGRDLGQ